MWIRRFFVSILLCSRCTCSSTVREQVQAFIAGLQQLDAYSAEASSSTCSPRQVFVTSRGRCGCFRPNDARCRSSCSRRLLMLQARSVSGWWDDPVSGVEGGAWPGLASDGAVRVHLAGGRSVTAAYDREWRLHGLVRIADTNYVELRTFRRGVETSPHWFLSCGALLASLPGGRQVLTWTSAEKAGDGGGGGGDGCRDLQVTSGFETGPVTLREPTWPVTLPILDFTDEEGEEEAADLLRVPAHLVRAASERFDGRKAVLTGMYAARCISDSYTPPDSLVSNAALLDLGGRDDQDHPYWRERLRDDPDCLRFSTYSTVPPGALAFTQVACFPGSGSKWIMELVQFMSGYDTAPDSFMSYWLLKSHQDDVVNVARAVTSGAARGPVSLERRFVDQFWAAGRAVLVLRAPRRAVLSWWTHVRTANPMSTAAPDAADLDLDSDEFCDFAFAEAENWRTLALDYISLVRDLLVVFFEDVKRDTPGQLTRILRFLRVDPVDPDRLACLIKYPMNKHKRRRTEEGKDALVFCPRAEAAMAAAAAEVADALKMYRNVTELPPEYET